MTVRRVQCSRSREASEASEGAACSSFFQLPYEKNQHKTLGALEKRGCVVVPADDILVWAGLCSVLLCCMGLPATIRDYFTLVPTYCLPASASFHTQAFS